MFLSNALTYLFVLPIFLVSLTIHEYAHAWVAYKYGDDTAKRMGRLTLNPLAHISLFGTIIMPLLVHFGWARPVPVDFSVLTKKQMFRVAVAGPAANVLMALVLAAAFHIFHLRSMPLLGNFVLLVILFNFILAAFNLIPIPPLDGSRMVYASLKSPQAINMYNNFSRFGLLILLVFLFFGGFQLIILPVVGVLYSLLGLPLPGLTIERVDKITSAQKPAAPKKQKSENKNPKSKTKKLKSKTAKRKSKSKKRESPTETHEPDKPRLIAFEVTRRCRFNCMHCRANAESGGDVDELTTGQCKKILKSVAKFCKPVIILTGGEPAERSDIYELIKYGRDLGMRMVMATCGYLIDDESIRKLKEAGVLALSISLDGASAETHDKFRQTEGAFEAAVQAAEIARRAGMRFQINTTISKINIDEIRGIVELTKRLGAYCFNAFILVPTGRGEEIADEILDPMRYEILLNELLCLKLDSEIEVRVTCGPQFARLCRESRAKQVIENVNGCMGGRGFGFISCRGDVQTCGFLDISAGNLIENNFDFAQIWSQSKFLNEIRDVSAYKGNCRVCRYVGICGGCRARAYAVSGDYLAEDPICNYVVREA